MNLPRIKEQTGARKRPTWMPDPGVHAYVRDMLYEDFQVEVDALPEHWIPLTIVGTLDWIVLCQWWIFRNTGIFQSDEPYSYVFEYDGYEFDPDQLLVFREEEERHKFKERRENPGITGKERTEALPWLRHDVFGSWLAGEHNLTPEEAEGFTPPTAFLEITMWATFMWVLDTYGRDWIYMQDELIACVYDFKVAYFSRWDETLLDPNIMVCTKRPINSCRYCGDTIWCVQGTEVDARWQFVCNHCLVLMAVESHHHLDAREERIIQPHCPHWKGVDGEPGACMSTCRHSGMSKEKVWEIMEERGSQRLASYREEVKGLGGRNPRQVAGQSMRDVVDHFNRTIGPRDPKKLGS